MLQMIPTKCPRCEKMVMQLNFFKQVKDKYFHVCEECHKLPKLSDDDLLLIGFHFGYQKAREDVQNFLNSNDKTN